MSVPPTSAKLTQRAELQRERILNAAQTCFIEQGFHAAGMALIAQAADMSPSLIYRYFDSKNAIIFAIVERQVANGRAAIRSLYHAPDFAAAVYEAFTQWRTADPRIMNAALFLEMTAEASRNPALANAFTSSDQDLRREISNWFSASIAEGGKGLAVEVAEWRAICMQCFMEGLAIRALREPDLSPEKLKAAIAYFVKGMFAA
jgi:AcrR family transcriptional regulator